MYTILHKTQNLMKHCETAEDATLVLWGEYFAIKTSEERSYLVDLTKSPSPDLDILQEFLEKS